MSAGLLSVLHQLKFRVRETSARYLLVFLGVASVLDYQD